MKALALKVVDVITVGFDKVGLVNAGLLVVGSRKILAFDAGRGGFGLAAVG